jgi:hypothetical protein
MTALYTTQRSHRTFKRLEGVTPGTYRDEAAAKEEDR